MDQVASVAGVPVSTGPRVPTPETPERGHTASCHTVANHRRTHRNRGTLIHTRPLFRAGILNGSPDLLFEILWSTLMIISVPGPYATYAGLGFSKGNSVQIAFVMNTDLREQTLVSVRLTLLVISKIQI